MYGDACTVGATPQAPGRSCIFRPEGEHFGPFSGTGVHTPEDATGYDLYVVGPRIQEPHHFGDAPVDSHRLFPDQYWQLVYETLVLNDWFTDELFHIENVHKVVAPMNRLLVDTERLLHDEPFPHEDKGLPRPDICLGTLPDNTPTALIEMLSTEFTENGYEVAVDSPFSGCALPEQYCGDSRVLAVMIEVNKKLYIDQPIPPYSESVMNPVNHPVRNTNTAKLQLQLHNAILSALRKFVKPVPPRPEGANGPPESQQRLSRLLHEMNRGNISPEMQQWWRNRY